MNDPGPRIFQGRIIELSVEQVQLPNGQHCELEIVHHPGGVAIVAQDGQGRFCLLRQYRHVMGGWIWEIPAGKREPGEAPELTAQRELQEEAGMQARHWTHLGQTASSPGIFTEVIQLYYATELIAQPTAHEVGEVIEVHWLNRAEVDNLIRDGAIVDAKTLVGFYLFNMRVTDS